jgi:hypothetical protein
MLVLKQTVGERISCVEEETGHEIIIQFNKIRGGYTERVHGINVNRVGRVTVSFKDDERHFTIKRLPSEVPLTI